MESKPETSHSVGRAVRVFATVAAIMIGLLLIFDWSNESTYYGHRDESEAVGGILFLAAGITSFLLWRRRESILRKALEASNSSGQLLAASMLQAADAIEAIGKKVDALEQKVTDLEDAISDLV